jgi:hypothetical protein
MFLFSGAVTECKESVSRYRITELADAFVSSIWK